jgi:nickel-dependent lactate racemase
MEGMRTHREDIAWAPGRAVRVPWGREELAIGLPADWPVYCARPGQGFRASPRPLAAMVEAALAAPLGCPPLRQLAREVAARPPRPGHIAIVVDDHTRHTPVARILPIVMEHLGVGRGVADERIAIHFAGGTHRPMTRRQMADRIGAEPVERFACYNNPLDDPGRYRDLGRTQRGTPVQLSAGVADADLRVLIGSVSAHLQAGFAGGWKMLFPGLASRATISKLHLCGTQRFRRLIGLSAEANPMRREIDRLGEFVGGVTFAVQVLPAEGHEPLAVTAGLPVQAQRALTAQGVQRFGCPTPGEADLLVANSFPLEHDLWQGFKCIVNTLFAAREGGVVVALIKADYGSDDMNLPKWTLRRATIRAMLRVTGREGLLSLFARLLPQVQHEAKFFVRFCLGTIRRNDVLIYSPTLSAEGIRFPGLELYDNLPALWARAGKLLGGRTPNVTVFPHGGVCYPLDVAG